MGRLLLPKLFLRPKREKDLIFTFLGWESGLIYEKKGIIPPGWAERMAGHWNK